MKRLFVALTSALLCGAALAACGDDGGRSSAPDTPTPIATIFPPRPDEQVTICVDTVEATRSFQEEAVEAIRSAMEQVMEHPIYSRAYTSGKDPVIDSGCPALPAQYDPAASRLTTPSLSPYGRLVSGAGYYRKVVFVIEDEEISRYPREHWRFTSEEYVCVGDVCEEVTDGLYLGTSDLGKTAFLIDLLEKHLVLEDRGDPLEPGYHP